jgi:serine/threonine protein kinase
MVRHDGSSVLMDFGLAGWDKIEILAGRGSIGTPMYQPPEQADVGGPFGKISPASDVYGLGATLYFMLASRHPFLGRTVKEVREKIKSKAPDPIGPSNPKVHPAGEALCLRCLKKRQNERFSTPKALNENIDKVLKLVLGDEGDRKAMVRLQRRIAAATRRRSEGGKSAQGKKPKGPKPRSPSGRGKLKSSMGKIPKSRISGKGPVQRRKRTTSGKQEPRDGPPVLVIIAAAGVLLVLLIGALALLSK